MQIIYSEAIQPFVSKCFTICKDILIQDAKISFGIKKFLYNGYHYPLHIVAFEGGSRLGYFDSSIMEIGIAKSLMFSEDDLLEQVIKHELAHLLCYLKHGNTEKPHGKEFREICAQYGWHEAQNATIRTEEVEKKSERLRGKILKLFDLSSSQNVHEASSALNKARELMIAHGIKVLDKEEGFVVMRVLESKRVNEKIRAISQILRSFFVFPVINHGMGKVYLEIFGEKSHVEIGEYLATLLNHKFEELWKNDSSLKGIRSKNSFFQGIASGFLRQVESSKHRRGVLVIEKALAKHAQMAYPHLRSGTSSKIIDQSALKKGERAGSKMKIPKGVKKSSLLRLLPLHKGS